MTEVPAYVARAVEQHDLGPLVVWRKGANPLVWSIGLGGLTVLGGGLLYAVMWLLSGAFDQLAASLDAIVVVIVVGAVAAAVLGVRGLVKGFTAHYVYERGVIRTRNRRVSVATWDHLDEVVRRAYAVPVRNEVIYVRFFDGRRWKVETVTHRDDDLDQRLVSAFLDAARRHGRPVTHLPRAYKDEGFLPPRWLLGPVLVAGFAVAYVINVILIKAGLSPRLAFAGGLLIAGPAVWVVGQAYRFLQVVAGVLTAIGGLAVITLVQDLLPSVNGWLVGAAVFAVELLVVRLLLRVNAALMPRIGAVVRWLYALTHRWRFRRRQEIALPSPATAGRLLSVPPSATTATGRSVVTFTVNGQPVTVFDRVRRWPRSEDRPQTVWQVHLPAPAMFQEYPDGSWVDGSALWYVQESQTRTGISPRRIRAVAARLVANVAPAASQR